MSNDRLPSEILLAHHTEGPIHLHKDGRYTYVEDKPMDTAHARYLGARVSEAIREVRDHEANGTPLAERCELCGYHHGIGAACLVPRVIEAGVAGDERAAVPYIGLASATRSRSRQQRKDSMRWAEIMATRRKHGHAR